jgi:hypothetical protein
MNKALGTPRTLVLVALPVLAASLSAVPENSTLMYVLVAALVVLSFAALRMADAWRHVRVEVGLLCATIGFIWLAYFFSQASPALRLLLPGAVGVLAALLIGRMLVRLMLLANRALRAS